MKQIKCALLALAIAVLAGCAGFANIEPPQSANESAAYAGATVQSVQQTAIAQYPYMTKAQATEVHEAIEQAKTLRKNVVQALLADTPTDVKAGDLQQMLLHIQALLAQYGAQQ